jgi:hypothetical protein
MKLNQNRTRQYPLFIILTMCVTLVPLASPLVPTAGASGIPTSLMLLAQAGDLDSSASEANSQIAMSADDGSFDTEQLEQLVAPIALYPDALLMQILMASTYPLEIIEADRWIGEKPELTGDALDKALLEEDWDPSVKSLTTLPSVLKQMSENLDWTQDLGDAFLAQENDLLDTVQRMRGLAYEAGNLETTEQQSVTQQQDKIIVIESPSPEVIYVPTYSPTVVYGPAWGYPRWYYPRWYYPPAPGYGFVAFSTGVVVGAAIWGGCRWGWGRNSVNININRHNEFNRNTNINASRNVINSSGKGGTAAWKHDSSHRKGVNYSSSNVAQKYGASSGSSRVTRNQARGHSAANASNRAGAGAQAGNRGVASSRPSPSAANRSAVSNSAARNPSAGNRSAANNTRARSPSTANRSASRGSAFSGSRSPSTDRMSSRRGAASRGATSYGGSRGGMSRGGGRRR